MANAGCRICGKPKYKFISIIKDMWICSYCGHSFVALRRES